MLPQGRRIRQVCRRWSMAMLAIAFMLSACTRSAGVDVRIRCQLERDWFAAACARFGERPPLNRPGRGLTWTTTEVWLQARFVVSAGRAGRRQARLHWGANRVDWALPPGVESLRLHLLAAGGCHLRLPLSEVVLDPAAPRPSEVVIELPDLPPRP